MTSRRSLRSELWENEDFVTRAQVVREADGLALAPSDCSAWGLSVYDIDEPTGSLYTVQGGAPSDVLSSTYTAWNEDSIGSNFEHVLGPSDYTRSGGHVYRHQYELFTNHEGRVFVVHDIRAKPLYGS